MTVVIVDTSIFMNVLDVRGFNQHRGRVLADFTQRIDRNESFVLPLAVIIETGNHIAQLHGKWRRHFAQHLTTQVAKIIDGGAPWVAARAIDAADLGRWIGGFPDQAMRGLGLTDVSLIDEYERQCELNPRRVVEIWASDHHLRAYRREP